jgi:hypothetical protein
MRTSHASVGHTEDNSALTVARCGLIDLGAQAEVPSARRTATPKHICGRMLIQTEWSSIGKGMNQELW